MDNINVRKEFGECKLIAFLRTDIYRISSKYDPDFDKRQPLFITWDKKNLKSLICERIKQIKELDFEDEDKLWNSVFNSDNINIPDTFEYMINKTMLRPRDILTFAMYVLDMMNKNNSSKISEDIFQEAEKFYSDYLLNNLRQEYSVGYPDIEDICLSLFLEEENIINGNDLKQKISDFPQLIENYSIEFIIKFCFETGILGIKIEEKIYFAYEGHYYDRLKAMPQLKNNILYAIHPGLYKVLSIKF